MEFEIKDLIKINLLNEMTSLGLNNRKNDEFYDYFMFKNTEWLELNKEHIFLINNTITII